MNNHRGSLGLLLFISLIFIASAFASAQTGRSRVTGLQLGDTPEGSRVSILSDVSFGYYEAFRRGDRFYVKIPLADLATTPPTLRSSGFENMLVQKQGDVLIISFKLQPGVNARVNQHANRLEVIFVSPNRAATVATGSATSGSSRDRGPDAAGPMPPDTSASRLRVRVVSPQALPANQSRFPSEPFTRSTQRGKANAKTNESVTSGSGPSALPGSSPATVLTPDSATTYQSSNASSPTVKPSSTASSSSSGWKHRLATAKNWMMANRLATLLGALILLSLIVYALLALRRRRKNTFKARSAKLPKAQPKYSSGEELNELPPRPEPSVDQAPPRAAAHSAAAASGYAGVASKPTNVSSPANQEADKEDREVFEL
jgi:hypothetical protein